MATSAPVSDDESERFQKLLKVIAPHRCDTLLQLRTDLIVKASRHMTPPIVSKFRYGGVVLIWR